MVQPARSIRPIHPESGVVPLGRFSPQDIDGIRLMLRGSSVVDWVKLHFSTDAEVDAFLRVNGLEPEDPHDQARILALFRRATVYLEDHLHYRIPDTVKAQTDVRWLFRAASRREARRSHRFFACILLKAMHILHHHDAHELLSMLQVSQAELAVLLRAKIERAVRGLLERGFPLVEFSGNMKTPNSIYSKLLGKRDTQSTLIFDKLRFRFVTERLEDLPSLLLALTQELLPFNYVVPGQTHNSLMDVYRMLVRAGNVATLNAEEDPLALNEPRVTDLSADRRNEFSGQNYRVINFVADVPLRIDRVLNLPESQVRALGPIVFGAVEFQVVDRATARVNETGESRHELYKERQRIQVRQRLERGRRPRKSADSEEAPS